MKMGKIAKVVGVVSDIAKADNPAEKAGAIAAGAAAVAHPVVGTLAAPLIKKGVSKVVQKGIDTANDPQVQAKAKEVGGRVKDAAVDLGNDAAGRIRTFASSHGF